MKIHDLLHQTFTNPLGHLLAATNVLMLIASFIGVELNQKFIFDLNRPAFLLDQAFGGEFFLPALVYLQWIFIAGFAKFLAAHIRPPQIS